MGPREAHQSPFHHTHTVGLVGTEAPPCRGCLTSPPPGKTGFAEGSSATRGDFHLLPRAPRSLFRVA